MPTQEEIDEAIEWATSEIIYKSFEADRARLIHYLETLGAAYRAERARAELAERQYAELSQCPNAWDSDAWNSLLARHEAERKAAGI